MACVSEEAALSSRLWVMSEKHGVVVILHAALLDVIDEAELLEGLLPDADDVVLVLADGGGQQVGDVLEDLADGLR